MSRKTELTAVDHARRVIAQIWQVLHGRSNATDPRVLVFQQHKVAYIPIPKAANSSIRAALLPLLGIDPRTIRNVQAFKGFEERRLSKCAANFDNEWFVFAVVRNPYARIVSAYFDKVVNRRTVLPSIARMGIRKGDSFERFIKSVATWPPHLLDHHIASQSQLLSRAPRCLKIFRVESLAVDWPTICSEIEQRSGLSLPPPGHLRSGRLPAHWSKAYNDSTRQIIEQMYAADFMQFGYVRNAATEPTLMSDVAVD